jgi:hypothetical protein
MDAQLQAAGLATKEGVVLRNLEWAFSGEGGDLRGHRLDTRDARFYLDVASHCA